MCGDVVVDVPHSEFRVLVYMVDRTLFSIDLR